MDDAVTVGQYIDRLEQLVVDHPDAPVEDPNGFEVGITAAQLLADTHASPIARGFVMWAPGIPPRPARLPYLRDDKVLVAG
jgi:hypothetical protein